MNLHGAQTASFDNGLDGSKGHASLKKHEVRAGSLRNLRTGSAHQDCTAGDGGACIGISRLRSGEYSNSQIELGVHLIGITTSIDSDHKNRSRSVSGTGF